VIFMVPAQADEEFFRQVGATKAGSSGTKG